LTHGHDTDELLKEIDRKQGAAKWPETLDAGRSVDEFLWKGDPKATPIQRLGLVIFAGMFLFLLAGFIIPQMAPIGRPQRVTVQSRLTSTTISLHLPS
jgi:hypothetical protein